MFISLNYTVHMTEGSCNIFHEDYMSIIVLCVYSCGKKI
jgi:hypothetical protein